MFYPGANSAGISNHWWQKMICTLPALDITPRFAYTSPFAATSRSAARPVPNPLTGAPNTWVHVVPRSVERMTPRLVLVRFRSETKRLPLLSITMSCIYSKPLVEGSRFQLTPPSVLLYIPPPFRTASLLNHPSTSCGKHGIGMYSILYQTGNGKVDKKIIYRCPGGWHWWSWLFWCQYRPNRSGKYGITRCISFINHDRTGAAATVGPLPPCQRSEASGNITGTTHISI